MKVAHRSLWVEIAFLTLLMLLAITCFHVGPAHATIDYLRIVPPSPTDQDSITIEFAGTFFDGCWDYQYGTCERPAPGTFLVDAYLTDSWQPGDGCPMVLVPYLKQCAVGPLSPGTYTVTGTQHGQSLNRYEYAQRSLQFTVTAFVPALPLTWSAIKTRY